MKQGYSKFYKKFNKKGIVGELFIFMILSFVLVIMCVLFMYMGNTIEERLINASIDTTAANWTETVENTFGEVNTAFETLTWLSFMVIVFMVISIFIGAWGVNSHPVLFIAYIFVTIISVIVSVALSNGYETLYNTPELTSTFAKFTGANFFFANLPIWITVIGLVGGTLMVIKLVRGREFIG